MECASFATPTECIARQSQWNTYAHTVYSRFLNTGAFHMNILCRPKKMGNFTIPATHFLNKLGWTTRSLNRKLQQAPCEHVRYLCQKTGKVIQRTGRKPLHAIAYITQHLADLWDDLDCSGVLYAFVTKHHHSIIKIGKARDLKSRLASYIGFNKPHVVLWTAHVSNRHKMESVLRKALESSEVCKKRVDFGNEWFELSCSAEDFGSFCDLVIKKDAVQRPQSA